MNYDMKKIIQQEYNDRFEAQSGCCAICGVHQSKLKRRLSIDHCHTILEVRGLLCGSCNTGIGMLKDDPVILRNAAAYIETAHACVFVEARKDNYLHKNKVV